MQCLGTWYVRRICLKANNLHENLCNLTWQVYIALDMSDSAIDKLIRLIIPYHISNYLPTFDNSNKRSRN